jgi:hypothetical protein
MFQFTKKGISLPIVIIIILVLVAGGFLAYYSIRNSIKKIKPPEDKSNLIRVFSPQPNQEVTSPLSITGEARGYWFFEAVFPIRLLDKNGNIIAQTPAQAQGDWMTEDFVPFSTQINFTVSETQAGTLVLEKDNPSGLPENADELDIPVVLKGDGSATNFSKTGNIVKNNPGFKPDTWYLIYEQPGAAALNVELSFDEKSLCLINSISQPCQMTAFTNGDRVRVEGWKTDGTVIVKNLVIEQTSLQLRTVKLYYYNYSLDKDASGNTLCSRQGLVAAERQVLVTTTPIQDTIRLLITGRLTNAEKSQGITTEYPLQGFSLKGASLNNGVLTLEFQDLNNKTGGGSCRVGILWFQIEATAKQFPEVQSVRFIPEELFQP